MASSCLCFCLLFISVFPADGFLHYMTARCEFSSSELKDIEYIQSYYYNRLEYTRFNSSVGYFVGKTTYGERNAEFWNNDRSILEQMNTEKERFCQQNIQLDEQYNLAYSGECVTVRCDPGPCLELLV
ncbi:hypothetical protein PBY51_005670 [Eleginops maclovinus]|uniref:MHC class II beta chain N-terminal domain-containing protein n=1 Tax=Eleginops maclovinus TaxID=56733 RepID=A0AAN7WV84_ELEMC|nr:hypothetical protein PBY51_005670 [Eleginops maclovinus]